jgi:hypothetical protein
LKAQVGAVVAVLAILVLALAAIGYSGLGEARVVTTTRTVTVLSAKSPVITEEVIVQPQLVNEVCIIQLTNSTSTAYVSQVNGTLTSLGGGAAVTTTETLRALTTATVYANVTEISGGITCTIINPHYNVTQAPYCPPCV